MTTTDFSRVIMPFALMFILLVIDLFVMHVFVFECATSNHRVCECRHCLLFFGFSVCFVVVGDGDD